MFAQQTRKLPASPLLEAGAARISYQILPYDRHTILVFGNKYLQKFSMQTNSWLESSTVAVHEPESILGHTITMLANQYLLMFGGYTKQRTASKECWLFHLPTCTWTNLAIATLPDARYYHTSIEWNQQVIVFGGYNPQDDTCYCDVHSITASKCDMLHNDEDDAPEGRSGHSAILFRDKMYIFGGCNVGKVFDNVWFFDLQARTWTEVTLEGGPKARTAHAACLLQGKYMLVAFGWNGRNYFNDVHMLDLENHTWIEVEQGNAISARYQMGITVLDERVMLYGGRNDRSVQYNELYECTILEKVLQIGKRDGNGTVQLSKELFDNDKTYADLILDGKDKEYVVHSCIMSSVQVLKNIITTKIINVKEFEPVAVETVVMYLYGLEPEYHLLNIRQLVDACNLAERWKLMSLLGKLLSHVIISDNMLPYLIACFKLSEQRNSNITRDKLLQLISDGMESLLAKSEYGMEDLSKEQMMETMRIKLKIKQVPICQFENYIPASIHFVAQLQQLRHDSTFADGQIEKTGICVHRAILRSQKHTIATTLPMESLSEILDYLYHLKPNITLAGSGNDILKRLVHLLSLFQSLGAESLKMECAHHIARRIIDLDSAVAVQHVMDDFAMIKDRYLQLMQNNTQQQQVLSRGASKIIRKVEENALFSELQAKLNMEFVNARQKFAKKPGKSHGRVMEPNSNTEVITL